MPDPALLDPAIAAMLEQLAAMGGPTVAEVTPTEARAMYKLIVAADGAAEEVGTVADVTIAGVPCRAYTPVSGAGGESLPTLAWFHGGGWVIGDLDTADTTARKLCNRSGCRVVSVDYRLAPEHPHPAAVDDCWAVVQELAATSSGAPLAVGGDSAGGNLAAVVSLLARDAGIPLRHQLLVYPVTDVSVESASYAENGEGYFLTADSMRWFIGHYTAPDQRTRWQVSPLLAPELAGVAPAHVVTAGFDPLRDEGDAYARRLADAGVPVEHEQVGSAVHGFFAMGSVTAVADEALDRAGGILARAMKLDTA
jgi:acetyl esterase